MRITDLLNVESIKLNATPKNKQEAIDELIDLQVKGGRISDREAYKEGILAREAMSTTAVGEGIAIPHAKSDAVKAPSLAAITVPGGVDYEAMDGEPSTLLFMIAAPNGKDVHLEVLSRLMTMLMDEDFKNKLLAAKDKNEFLKIIDDTETAKYPDETKAVAENDGRIRVLAVTACPTGIAHTYMAAEALENAGKKLGITVKAETNGSGGAKNVLTKEEIEACDGIIIAADKTVDMARFDGKRVIRTKVSDGIKIPEELIERIEKGDAPVYHHTGAKATDESTDGENFGRKLYKHLMNGVSNMLPFTVAGGIFIALAFLIDTIAGAPQDSSFGTYTPLAAFLKNIGGYAFSFMIPVLAGYIGKSIADRPGFLVGLVGGFLATTGSTFANLAGEVPSGFLGALLAGFAGGYLMLGVEKLCDHMPKSLNGIKPVLI
ncbi:MAG: fructose PTS transporter subunit IIA, partial [Monoglobaceae bacterium]